MENNNNKKSKMNYDSSHASAQKPININKMTGQSPQKKEGGTK